MMPSRLLSFLWPRLLALGLITLCLPAYAFISEPGLSKTEREQRQNDYNALMSLGATFTGSAAGSMMAAAVPGTAAGWANMAITSAITSATANASINLVNTQGNLNDTLKNTFSTDSIKGYASAAVIAGVASSTEMWGRTMTERGNTLLTNLPERAEAYALNTLVKGVVTGASDSGDWGKIAGIGLAGELYEYWVGRDPDIQPGVDRPDGPTFKPLNEEGFARVPIVTIDSTVREGKNIGLNLNYLLMEPGCTSVLSVCHGTPISNALNVVPGFNAFATLHDTWMNWFDKHELTSKMTNIGSMPPALILNYGAVADKYYWLKPIIDQHREGRK